MGNEKKIPGNPFGIDNDTIAVLGETIRELKLQKQKKLFLTFIEMCIYSVEKHRSFCHEQCRK